MPDTQRARYGPWYFAWQAPIGAFGGWANLPKFSPYVHESDRVLDFGCGGGYLLKALRCARRQGIEVNPAAAAVAEQNGVDVFRSAAELPDQSVDVVISNHALEHATRPLDELRELFRVLRPRGKIVFVVPCESISRAYRPEDINHHLYSWSPMCIGNLFTEAGFVVLESRPFHHKWPPGYRVVAALGGRKIFDALSRCYAVIERSWFQVRVVAEKPLGAAPVVHRTDERP